MFYPLGKILFFFFFSFSLLRYLSLICLDGPNSLFARLGNNGVGTFTHFFFSLASWYNVKLCCRKELEGHYRKEFLFHFQYICFCLFSVMINIPLVLLTPQEVVFE